MKNVISVASAIVVSALAITGCAQPAEKENTSTENKGIEARVADAYGVDHFKDAKTIAFTFNIKKDTATISRSWLWDIPGNVVTYNKGDETVTYRRDTISTEAMKKIDGTFTNDQYWLLFPYHLVWDSGMVVTKKEEQEAPISKQESTMLTVQYHGQSGYTPGDAYDLFIGDDNMIKEWNFRKGGSVEPTMTTTWSAPMETGGMKIAMDHQNADSTFRLFFTDVKVN